ncbi:MAG: DNA methylase [Firmicutes bacterium]|nr:DNA methylase [Bacillota bacterium]
MKSRIYIAIDLKSFYASVECMERGLDPMTTNLVVADDSRTTKTICLAVSPALKAHGIPGRPRLFEVVQKVKEINAKRRRKAPGHTFTGSSCDDNELSSSPDLSLDYITAPPRMARYMEYSTRIYDVYLKHIAPEDIHVYSIDEVFMDITDYLNTYKLSPRELAKKIILDVLATTGITATAGIGTNLYLAKIAMDIQAKRIPTDESGVRIAELDEMSYRRLLWSHRPITDFWRVGRGYAKKLEGKGLYTMGDIARCSLGEPTDFHNEDLLYRLFGVNAELLIDHAWGWEPCTIADIKAYKPSAKSVGSGQVLHNPYSFEKAKLVVREMTELLVLDLVDKELVTDQMVLTVGYDIENLKDEKIRQSYHGAITTDHYGRSVPKHAHGSVNLKGPTSSTKQILQAVMELFERIVDQNLLVRRVTIAANHVVDEASIGKTNDIEQLDLFTDYQAEEVKHKQEEAELIRERKTQEATLAIRKKYGKNAILKGMNLEEGATTTERNKQIGGHKA